jgi:hypothetical protein
MTPLLNGLHCPIMKAHAIIKDSPSDTQNHFSKQTITLIKNHSFHQQTIIGNVDTGTFHQIQPTFLRKLLVGVQEQRRQQRLPQINTYRCQCIY